MAIFVFARKNPVLCVLISILFGFYRSNTNEDAGIANSNTVPVYAAVSEYSYCP